MEAHAGKYYKKMLISFAFGKTPFPNWPQLSASFSRIPRNDDIQACFKRLS